MDKKPNIAQIKLYLDGSCSDTEAAMVENWIDSSPENSSILLQVATGKEGEYLYDSDLVLANIIKEIDQSEQAAISLLPNKRSHLFNKNSFITRLVAIFLMISTIGLGIYLFNLNFSENHIVNVVSSPETITKVTLPDGSHVALNAGSRIRYKSSFTGEERKVFLEGQAYFDVAKSNKPFKIRTGEITTNVLGTKFYVNYLVNTGKVEVGLYQGKVSVARNNIFGFAKSKVTLKPNQFVSYSLKNNNIDVDIKEGVENKTLWREGILRFQNTELNEVAEILGKWYGVPIIIKKSNMLNCKVEGTFKKESLEHVLLTLRFVTGFRYEIGQDQIIIYGGNCE